jgi:hypothetical protein
MKVLLINPPREIPQVADYPPIGLLHIGAVADRKGHAVIVRHGVGRNLTAVREPPKLLNNLDH